jgi:transcriptional regulator with XRE-family HTH domain
MDNPLDIEVRQALVQRRGQWPRIAEECGVSHSWISQFVRDKIPNPGFATLTKLHAYLTRPVTQQAA